jgi:hypothetical protein
VPEISSIVNATAVISSSNNYVSVISNHFTNASSNATSNAPSVSGGMPKNITSSTKVVANSTSSAKLGAGTAGNSSARNLSASDKAKVDACLEAINFTKFKEKVLARVDAAKVVAKAGAEESNHHESLPFKRMMDMITNLEISSSILELYVIKLNTCYASVLEEVRAEQHLTMQNAANTSATVDAQLAHMQHELDHHTPAGRTFRAQIRDIQVATFF